ncbi:MAG: tRNA (cytidine(56)-2'-O)-methyltransferase [Thermoprotei archaeon]
MKVVVLRYGHRISRDKRITTHVALVARAFGAEGIYIYGEYDESVARSLDHVAETWGGSFWSGWIDDYVSTIQNWKKEGGIVVHLTMYGQDLEEVMGEVSLKDRIMVFVGSSKVPPEVYRLADYNVGVGHQPHSEVAALAVFLDRLFKGQELMKRFNGARFTILPSKAGKIVRETQDEKNNKRDGRWASKGE